MLLALGSGLLTRSAAAQSDPGHSQPIVPSGDTTPGAPDPGRTGETGTGVPTAVPNERGVQQASEQPPAVGPASDQVPPSDQAVPVYPQGYTPPEGAYDSYSAGSAYTDEVTPDELEALEGGPGAREHEGFFLRLSVGPGAGGARYREKIDGETSTVEARGLAGLFDVAVGASVVGNLIVHGNLLFTRFESPTRRVDDVKDASLRVTSSSTMLGAGVSYYFMPVNVYLTGSLGLAWAFERRAGDQLRSGTGMYVAAALGKEWWVGRSAEWGLGAQLRSSFAAAPIDIAGVESTLKLVTIGLAFSATFN